MKLLRNLLIALLAFAAPAHAVVQSLAMRDANLTVDPAAYSVRITQPFTAARTLTLPLAGGTYIGQSGASTYYQNVLTIFDNVTAITSVNTLTITAASGDTINGASTLVVNSSNNTVMIWPVSSSAWKAVIIRAGNALVPAVTCSANQWVSAIAADGTATCSATGTVVTAGKTATFTNTLTFGGTDASTIAFGVGGTIGAVGYSATGQIQGTATNDAAAAGKVGEYFESLQSSAANFPTTAQFGNIGTSLALTAGDWDLNLIINATPNGATVNTIEAGFGTVTGNDGTGVVLGINATANPGPTVNSNASVAVTAYRVSLASPTTYFCKVISVYSVAIPQYTGRCSARRIR